MTRQDLDNYVDAQVTNKTIANSLSPTNEGDAIKKVADYADQQDLLKEDKSNKSTDGTLSENSEINYPCEKAVKTYVDSKSIPYLESAFKLSQSGTGEPQVANGYIDQVQISPNDNTDPLFRIITYNYVGVGQYNVQILWKTGSASAINVTKIDISCSDAKIRFGSNSNGSIGPYSYYQQDFNVYDATGALANGVLGSTSMYFRLFN